MTFLRLPLLYRCTALAAAIAGYWLGKSVSVTPVVVGALILAELISIREVLTLREALDVAARVSSKDRR